MSTKERLHELVEAMSQVEADELLERIEYVASLLTPEDLASIERGRAQARAGQLRSTEEVFESLRTKV
ncbi:hypothetical protein [Candidatus Amarobacter glycogenicus]|jgi:predicted transcriptional regulator|uniref:hypothetical protein n=1 Tax=Candidatus Amarobacter glycogenicus TaxID=3140699 RepID=UPI0031351502|nr:hypothetical protein [Dehalococcoidia bacterium]MBK9342440.1 hypothetical protein [Dehalococcoidia bacterium]MCC6269242.1 hypothetical protein [Dehalococcoidia bacterium]